MKNTIGESYSVTIFGESHGEYIGCIIDGIAPGIKIDRKYIDHQLTLRRPAGAISTSRVETDKYQIISGVVNDVTTGTALTVIIPNTNTKSSDYDSLKDKPRPGHADYTAQMKYHGYQDARGGGHFSGRLTAAVVVAGAISSLILKNHGIKIGSHVARCACIDDDKMTRDDIDKMNELVFAVINQEKGNQMIEKCLEAKANGDSVGGIIETIVTGIDSGIGEPFFDTVEGNLAKLLFAIPAVKGVSFGDGFAISDKLGSQANDSFVYEDGKVKTLTNHNGGINGGITNGMDLLISTAIKPTPSISQKQMTVSLKNQTNVELEIKGRHDPAIVHRARVVVDSMVAIGLVDMCSLRYGTDWQKGE